MKKVLVYLLCAVVICSVFVGCGGSGTSDSDSAGAETAAADDSGSGSTAPSVDTSNASVVIKAGHGIPEDTGMHAGWLKFKEEVEKNSNGEIAVEIYPNQQMGGDRELIEATQMGDITACTPSSTPIAPFCEEFYVLDIPFLFSDRAQAYEVLDGAPGQQLLDALEGTNLKGLGFMENGFRNFSNSKVAVREPGDVAGMKIRTMENKIHMSFWNMVGASPTPMAFGELFTALQQKTVDGQENPFELIYNNKFYEAQDYITETRHIYTPYVVLFNESFYNGLSDEHRQIVDDAMKVAVDEARRVSTESEVDFKQKIEDAGVEIIALTDDELGRWREAMSPVLDEVRQEAGDAIVDAFVDATGY